VSISDDPDQIRRDIERTQAHLSSDVDALTEKVTPSRIVERRVGRARAAAGRLRDRVMGADDSVPSHYRTGTGPAYGDVPYGRAQPAGSGLSGTASSAASSVSDAASSAASTVSDAASSAATAVQEAPQAARRQTQGNPLAPV